MATLAWIVIGLAIGPLAGFSGPAQAQTQQTKAQPQQTTTHPQQATTSAQQTQNQNQQTPNQTPPASNQAPQAPGQTQPASPQTQQAPASGAPADGQPQPPPKPPGQVPSSDLKPAPPTPIAEKKAELGDDHTWNPDWDKIIEENLPSDLLTPKVGKAVKQFCPRFNVMTEPDRRSYWAYFFQALAGAEAGLEPTKDVRHTEPELAVKDDVTHRMVRQEGLLQLTYMDQERYGCDFDWEKDKELPEHDPGKTILQPKKNLLCGVSIIRNQLIDQHKPLLSKTSYFSTLQPGTVSVKVFLKQMANVPAACGRKVPRTERQAPVREAAAMSPSSPSTPAGQSASAVSSTPGAH